MRVGVDIDGVLADSLPLWINELNTFFQKERRMEDIHLYDICQSYGITEEELSRFIVSKGRSLMSGPTPLPGAAHYLSRIKQNHRIYIVTARSGHYRRETSDWLKQHGMPYDDLVLLGSHEKKECCLELKLGVLVEDTLEISVQVSSAGVPVLLMDAPYNQGELPRLVYRKQSWDEVYRTIIHEPQKLVLSRREYAFKG